MCDTFVRMPARTGEPVYFGKNSDREPNEAQEIVRYAAHRRSGKRVETTYITVDAPQQVREVILSKPFQMWGAEMGCNADGVAIGNEAVFTRLKKGKRNPGLTGMDLLRLALEQSGTAAEARDCIIAYLEKFGQDANAGYRKSFFYHNSFLIADPSAAFVLETAGRHWAWQKVDGYRAISNGLTIEDDYDAVSSGAVEFAERKGWVKHGQTFSFRAAFGTRFMPRMASCDARVALSVSKAETADSWNVQHAFRILRSHATDDFHPANARTNSLCMHASGMLCPAQTTGSMAAVLRAEHPPTVWLTGSSAPCLSLYKPFYFGTEVLDSTRFPAPGPMVDQSYWWTWEGFHRAALMPYKKHIAGIRDDQQRQEQQWVDGDQAVFQGNAEAKAAHSSASLAASLRMLKDWKQRVGLTSSLRHVRYQRFWNRLNKKV